MSVILWTLSILVPGVLIAQILGWYVESREYRAPWNWRVLTTFGIYHNWLDRTHPDWWMRR